MKQAIDFKKSMIKDFMEMTNAKILTTGYQTSWSAHDREPVEEVSIESLPSDMVESLFDKIIYRVNSVNQKDSKDYGSILFEKDEYEDDGSGRVHGSYRWVVRGYGKYFPTMESLYDMKGNFVATRIVYP